MKILFYGFRSFRYAYLQFMRTNLKVNILYTSTHLSSCNTIEHYMHSPMQWSLSWWRREFPCPSRKAPSPTQSPIKEVPDFFPGLYRPQPVPDTFSVEDANWMERYLRFPSVPASACHGVTYCRSRLKNENVLYLCFVRRAL